MTDLTTEPVFEEVGQESKSFGLGTILAYALVLGVLGLRAEPYLGE